MKAELKLNRAWEIRGDRPLRVEMHSRDCDCPASEPYRAAAPPPALTFVQIGNLVWLGLAVGTAIAFAIDPHGAWAALSAIFGGVR